MSYEIVKSIALKQDKKGFWYAIVTSACNNVRPHTYHKWSYCKNIFSTKEELQKEILLDFYYGNFHGGTSTRYGKFLQFLGGSWCCENKKSRACNIYHFYENIQNKLRNMYNNSNKDITIENKKKLYDRLDKIEVRQSRELKNQLYKEFLEFKPNRKPTIVRLWKDNKSIAFIRQYKNQRKGAYFANSFESATRFTSNVKLAYIKKLAEQNGYKVEFIEV